eukprot:gnl/Hemi2/23316_TR7825_c0_g1_i1.p2 gnl/Hemi2/23316_TR7825_c0_g1~~gnl/Hemi2/23316_TR7825_c0_g1_i1.p2  ORF type:complete len:114 (+),score=34.39 gnl/Hemi2/23316_TR7825_c0_g1_i1:45-344(+)
MSQARYMSVYNEGVALDTENCLCKYECAVQVGSAKERKIRGKPGPAGEPAKLSTTEHILNSILPPREYQVVVVVADHHRFFFSCDILLLLFKLCCFVVR